MKRFLLVPISFRVYEIDGDTQIMLSQQFILVILLQGCSIVLNKPVKLKVFKEVKVKKIPLQHLHAATVSYRFLRNWQKSNK